MLIKNQNHIDFEKKTKFLLPCRLLLYIICFETFNPFVIYMAYCGCFQNFKYVHYKLKFTVLTSLKLIYRMIHK